MGRVRDLVHREMQRPAGKTSSPEMLELCDFIRRGKGDEVIEELMCFFRLEQPPMLQQRALIALTECVVSSGPQFFGLLSQEKYLERIFKLVRECKDLTTRDAFLRQVFIWTIVYKTSGINSLHQKFTENKSFGARYKIIITEERKRMVNVPTVSGTRSSARLLQNNIETFILEAEGDLAALEYALEHPEMLDENNVDDCRRHRERAEQLIETGMGENALSKDALTSLRVLIDQLRTAINLHDAIFGETGDKKDAAVEEEREHNSMTGTLASNAIAAGKQAIDDLVAAERKENQELRAKLEEAINAKEEVQNKYKSAKDKNKKLIQIVEEYGTKLDEYETAAGSGSAAAGVEQIKVKELEAKVAALQKSNEANRTVDPKVVAKIRAAIASMRKQLRGVKETSLSDLGKEITLQSVHVQGMIARIVEASANDRKNDVDTIRRLQDLYKREVKLRKQYYNMIQDLKGNIRVYARVRPLTSQETSAGHSNAMTVVNNEELFIQDERGKKRYEFECVFGPDSTQEQVFADTAPLIDSVVDGYNVCVFAYGQTGSGKTWTMSGQEGKNAGVNRRAIERLFAIIKEREGSEESTVCASVMEIYCETIRDLLVTRVEAKKFTYEAKQGGQFGNYVTNLKELTVTSPDDIEQVLGKAQKNRSEGQTDMNEHSSRSHMILYIIVKTRNKETGIGSYGKLSLVDLAGSERLDKSNATGQLQKEAISINKSLSALGDVIQSLSSQAKHVPIRNSCLTMVLSDCLQQESHAKVLMFACVSPANYNVSESNCTLLFANRARGVALGPVKKNPKS